MMYHDGKTVSYTYNEGNQLIQVQDWLGGYQFEMQAMQPKKIQDSFGNTTYYSFDEKGHRTHTEYPNKQKIQYHYDEAGRLTHINCLNNTEIDYHYDASGALAQIITPKFKTQFTYDHRGRKIQTTLEDSGGNKLYTQRNSYDLFGNKFLEQKFFWGMDGEEETLYTYDQLHQLILIEGQNQKVAFFYDSLGNRIREEVTTKNENIRVNTYTYNDENQLVQMRCENKKIGRHDITGTVKFSYDLRGNMIQMIHNERQLMSFTYDSANQLVESENCDGNKRQYIYDGLGRRIKKIVDHVESYYIYDLATTQIHPIMIKGKEEHIQLDDKGFMLHISKEKFSFTIKDDLGNAVLKFNEKGEIEPCCGVDAFGVRVSALENTIGHETRFAGHPFDSETGLYFAGARYYMPEIGRFISRDVYSNVYSKHPDHPYIYCDNNPIAYTDPTGHWKKSIHLHKTEELSCYVFMKHGFENIEAIKYAKIIAKGNQGVDTSVVTTSFMPDSINGIGKIVGDQGWHFNMNIKYRWGSSNDSRVIRFRRCYAQSVKHFNHAQKRYEKRNHHLLYGLNVLLTNKSSADLKWLRYKNLQEERALHTFGMGLHPLQDQFAHMDFGYEDILTKGGVFTLHPKEYDDPEYDNGAEGTLVYVGSSTQGHETEWLSKRWFDTKTATIHALEEFVKATYRQTDVRPRWHKRVAQKTAEILQMNKKGLS